MKPRERIRAGDMETTRKDSRGSESEKYRGKFIEAIKLNNATPEKLGLLLRYHVIRIRSGRFIRVDKIKYYNYFYKPLKKQKL